VTKNASKRDPERFIFCLQHLDLPITELAKSFVACGTSSSASTFFSAGRDNWCVGIGPCFLRSLRVPNNRAAGGPRSALLPNLLVGVAKINPLWSIIVDSLLWSQAFIRVLFRQR